MISVSRNSLCPNLNSQDSQSERAGKFPEIDECSARNGCGCTAPSTGVCQVPAVMSRIQAEAAHMVLGVSRLIPPSTQSWRRGAFLYLQEKVIALNFTGWAWPLTRHRTALWNEASAVVLLVEGEGRREGEPELSTWHSLNVRRCNLQVIWDSWEMQRKSHYLPPSPSCYKIEYVVNRVHG